MAVSRPTFSGSETPVALMMVGSHSDYPGFVAKKGQVGVQEFFRDVADNWNFEEFSPQEFYAADDKVFVLGHSTATLKRNGRSVASDWVHVFTIRNGEVAKFREFNDSAQIAAAWSA